MEPTGNGNTAVILARLPFRIAIFGYGPEDSEIRDSEQFCPSSFSHVIPVLYPAPWQ